MLAVASGRSLGLGQVHIHTLPSCIEYNTCDETAHMASIIWEVQKEQMADTKADT